MGEERGKRFKTKKEKKELKRGAIPEISSWVLEWDCSFWRISKNIKKKKKKR